MAKTIRLDRISRRQLGTSNGCRDHTVLPYATVPLVLRKRRSLTAARQSLRPPCNLLLTRDTVASTASRTPRIVTTRTPLFMRRDEGKRTAFAKNEKRIIFRMRTGRPKSPCIGWRNSLLRARLFCGFLEARLPIAAPKRLLICPSGCPWRVARHVQSVTAISRLRTTMAISDQSSSAHSNRYDRRYGRQYGRRRGTRSRRRTRRNRR